MSTVGGKEAWDLISRCQRALDEKQKVQLGDHAGEQRVSLKARLIKVDWIKIGHAIVYKAEKTEAPIPSPSGTKQHYTEDSFENTKPYAYGVEFFMPY